jgi:small subunit ribosomal protein S4
MARYTGASCRQCRREGTKLFLKGSRCLTEKCAVERRGYAPASMARAAAARARRRNTRSSCEAEGEADVRPDERQFRNTFDRVTREAGVKNQPAHRARVEAGQYRLPHGLSASRKGARQLVRHGHVEVNGHKVDVPSTSCGRASGRSGQPG